MTTTKRCNACKTVKDTTCFYAGSNRARYSPECKPCMIDRAKKYAQKVKHTKGLASRLKRDFSLDIKDFQLMREFQNNRCAICLIPEENTRLKILAVDHDHTTGVVRGLLCDTCNRGIGLLKDSADNLKRAIDYLKRGSFMAVRVTANYAENMSGK